VSSSSTLVTARHFEYIAARTRQEDDLLRDLKAAAVEAGIPAIWIAPEQAALMGILLRLCGARTVIEVGTLAGSAAIAMARALPPNGHVHTIEIHPPHAEFARAWIARSDVAEKVTVHLGSGAEILPGFADGSIDAVFLDADKAGYAAYLEQARRLLRPGGMLLVDNAFAFGQLFDEQPTDREAPAVQAFNEILARDPDFESVIVPIGDGLWVGTRL